MEDTELVTITKSEWRSSAETAWKEVTAATERADEWEVEAKRLARMVVDLTAERLDLKRQLAASRLEANDLRGKPKS